MLTFPNNMTVFLPLNRNFVLANNVDPGKIKRIMALYLDLDCL